MNDWPRIARLGYVPTFWHVSENFGDALAPFLVRAISGLEARYFNYTFPESPLVHMVVGSLLNSHLRNAIVWGTGSAVESQLDPAGLPGPGGDVTIVATRGHLSRRKFEAAGHAPVAVGDPAFLLPRYYRPESRPRHEVGIVCSWVDHESVASVYPEIPVIGSLGGVEQTIEEICSCERIVAGSLHGLVAAVAYERPVIWARFSDRLIGDDFKFRDVLSTLDVQSYEPLELRRPVDKASLIDATFRHSVAFDGDALLSCCPFRGG
jgi:pyruvyltransferase